MGLCQENEERWPEEPNPGGDWSTVSSSIMGMCQENEERWPEEPNPDWEVVNCTLLNYGTVSGE